MKKYRLIAAALVAAVLIFCLPAALADDAPRSSIANAGSTFFAVRSDGALIGWGVNTGGVLVDREDISHDVRILSPIVVRTGVDSLRIRNGGIYAELRGGGSIYLCDDLTNRSDCDLRDETLFDESGSPLLFEVVDVATDSGGINLALTRAGKLMVWGSNSSLLLGDVTYDANVTTPIVMLENISLEGYPPAQSAEPSSEPSSAPPHTTFVPPFGDEPVITPTAAPQPERTPYLDVMRDRLSEGPAEKGIPTYWAVDEVELARQRGILPPEFEYDFQQNITRLEFCVLLDCTLRAATGSTPAALADELGLEQPNGFVDTDYAEPFDMARLDIVRGVGEDRFDPESPITRQEAATMLRRAAGVLGLDLTAEHRETGEPVDDWAVGGVDYVLASGVMKGTGHGFEPLEPYTREQSILTLVRLYDLAAENR